MELRLKHLSVVRDGREIVKDVTTYFETGTVVMLIGPNGCGKSTLLRALAGLIEFDGDLVLPEGYRSPEELTGYVFQNPETQIVGSTVFEDVVFGLENIGLSKDEMRRRAEYVLELLELSHLVDFDPYYLSGGQKQRLAIASILALEPEFLLLDEVTSMLDKRGKLEVLQAVVKLRDMNKGIVIATHELELFAPVSDRCIYLNEGRIQLDGSPEDVVDAYKKDVLELRNR